jgi:hypothetical protein
MCAARLVKEKRFCWDELRTDFYLLDLPELEGGRFCHVLAVPREQNAFEARLKQKLQRKCFVGCRFDRGRKRFARLLQDILGYYGYEPYFSDTGYWKGQILEEIIKGLSSRKFEFALFDNRATEGKPNVYIEVGAAYALRKPLILFDYRLARLPSDLAGFSTIRYQTYRSLARQLSRRLPKFLSEG